MDACGGGTSNVCTPRTGRYGDCRWFKKYDGDSCRVPVGKEALVGEELFECVNGLIWRDRSAVGVWWIEKGGAAEDVGVLTGCCHCTGGGYTMAMERLPGTGKGSSDQALACAEATACCCGRGMARLGSGGNLFTDGGGSKDLLMGVCKVGTSGALL